MLRLIGAKLLYLVPVLFLVSVGTFMLLELVPGDPAVAVLGPDATTEQILEVREELRLDDPLVPRFLRWLGGAVSGDFGTSLVEPANSVSELISLAFPLTLQLALMALFISLATSIPLALWTAYREGSAADRTVGALAAALISIPPFLAALMLIFVFVFNPGLARVPFGVITAALIPWFLWRAFKRSRIPGGPPIRSLLFGAFLSAFGLFLVIVVWPDFPRVGMSRLTAEEGVWENFVSAILPATTLALTEIAVFTRLLRTDLIATFQEDFVLAARARGLPMWRILVSDALRPSSFSLITLAGVSLGRLIGGTVIIESVFGIQGMGRLVAGNVFTKDFTIVQGGVLVIATAYVVLNTAVDISYNFLDPRVRRGRR